MRLANRPKRGPSGKATALVWKRTGLSLQSNRRVTTEVRHQSREATSRRLGSARQGSSRFGPEGSLRRSRVVRGRCIGPRQWTPSRGKRNEATTRRNYSAYPIAIQEGMQRTREPSIRLPGSSLRSNLLRMRAARPLHGKVVGSEQRKDDCHRHPYARRRFGPYRLSRYRLDSRGIFP